MFYKNSKLIPSNFLVFSMLIFSTICVSIQVNIGVCTDNIAVSITNVKLNTSSSTTGIAIRYRERLYY